MKEFTCIVCPNGCRLSAAEENGSFIVEGALCPKGREYAAAECTLPMRTLTTTVATVFEDTPRLPVRTRNEIPKEKLAEAMLKINRVKVDRRIRTGEVVLADVFGTDIIATTDL